MCGGHHDDYNNRRKGVGGGGRGSNENKQTTVCEVVREEIKLRYLRYLKKKEKERRDGTSRLLFWWWWLHVCLLSSIGTRKSLLLIFFHLTHLFLFLPLLCSLSSPPSHGVCVCVKRGLTSSNSLPCGFAPLLAAAVTPSPARHRNNCGIAASNVNVWGRRRAR
jgi:hypothetical protein